MTLAGADKMQGEIVKATKRLDDLRPAYATAAQTVTRAQTGRAPRRTGRLAASVRPSVDMLGGQVESLVPYASFVHWGTNKMAANPWLFEAARSSEPQWIRAFEEITDEALSMIDGLK
jgi:hypothetical protein